MKNDLQKLFDEKKIIVPEGLRFQDLPAVSHPEKAVKVIRFIQTLCTHTKGKWAGKKFILLVWQFVLIWRLFGKCVESGLRQFRTCYCEIPKKNGKSELAAAIALYMLCADGEQGAEVYSAAADTGQAGLVYEVAAQMVRNSSVLSRRLKIIDSRKRIVYFKTNSFYQVLSSESYTKHGINPSCIIFDELHSQPNDELWRVLTSGTDYAREQQLVFAISTAGIYDKNSIWWKIREKARQIKDGILKNASFLPILYIADKEKDNPEDRKLWERVNPSLGHIFTIEKIEKDFNEAKQDPVDYIDFLRFRLNIPVNQINKWMPMDHWDRCAGRINEDHLKNRLCCGGLDLASKTDLTAFVLVFPPIPGDQKWIVVPKFYVPEDTIIKRSRQDNVRYDIWADRGLITATPGNVIDNAFIENDVLEASKKYNLQEVGFDPWGATDTAVRLTDNHGISMIEMRQGTRTMSEPAKDLLVKVMKTELNHGGHEVLRWCADNLVMKKDVNENVQPAKDKATDRIDGMVALIMAHGRAMFHKPKSTGNDGSLI